MSLYGRVFTSVYDRSLEGTERAGLARIRHDLLAQATGDVLEIGAGTGLNLDHYGRSVDRLVLTEPSPAMAARLRRRVGSLDGKTEITLAGAEALPYPDDSFDTAVSTLTLCTVESPERALTELRRVLRPGGRLLFVEHVRAEQPGLARWQDRLEPLWRRIGNGCRCNRRTAELIGAAGFEVSDLDRGRLPKAPPIVRPIIVGRALAP
jgi:ubiquinone/menaquinone biosynthesis C-methylase UbiE